MTEASVNLFPGVRVVLVETSHPGNIGASARAMKNMGLTELVLVNPQDFPNDKALYRAVSAEDVVRNARVVASVGDAIADCGLVIGTSARDRRIPWPMLAPDECGEAVNRHAVEGVRVALLFGRESRGLTNEELRYCQFHVNIPTGKAYSSLNLAMAVQVICYEILRARAAGQHSSGSRVSDKNGRMPGWDMPFADAAAMEHFFAHLDRTLTDIKFHDPANPRQLMTRLRRMFNRIRPDQMEINILRGILNAVDELAEKKAK